jgi:hypothetical protein
VRWCERMAMLTDMLRGDRERWGITPMQAARTLGVSVVDYRAIEAEDRTPLLRRPLRDLQAVRVGHGRSSRRVTGCGMRRLPGHDGRR